MMLGSLRTFVGILLLFPLVPTDLISQESDKPHFQFQIVPAAEILDVEGNVSEYANQQGFHVGGRRLYIQRISFRGLNDALQFDLKKNRSTDSYRLVFEKFRTKSEVYLKKQFHRSHWLEKETKRITAGGKVAVQPLSGLEVNIGLDYSDRTQFFDSFFNAQGSPPSEVENRTRAWKGFSNVGFRSGGLGLSFQYAHSQIPRERIDSLDSTLVDVEVPDESLAETIPLGRNLQDEMKVDHHGATVSYAEGNVEVVVQYSNQTASTEVAVEKKGYGETFGGVQTLETNVTTGNTEYEKRELEGRFAWDIPGPFSLQFTFSNHAFDEKRSGENTEEVISFGIPFSIETSWTGETEFEETGVEMSASYTPEALPITFQGGLELVRCRALNQDQRFDEPRLLESTQDGQRKFANASYSSKGWKVYLVGSQTDYDGFPMTNISPDQEVDIRGVLRKRFDHGSVSFSANNKTKRSNWQRPDEFELDDLEIVKSYEVETSSISAEACLIGPLTFRGGYTYINTENQLIYYDPEGTAGEADQIGRIYDNHLYHLNVSKEMRRGYVALKARYREGVGTFPSSSLPLEPKVVIDVGAVRVSVTGVIRQYSNEKEPDRDFRARGVWVGVRINR